MLIGVQLEVIENQTQCWLSMCLKYYPYEPTILFGR